MDIFPVISSVFLVAPPAFVSSPAHIMITLKKKSVLLFEMMTSTNRPQAVNPLSDSNTHTYCMQALGLMCVICYSLLTEKH